MLKKVKAEISEQIKGIAVGASKEELETIKSEFDAKLKAQWAETEIKLSEGVKSDKPLTFGEQLKSEFEKAGFIENEGVKFDIKDTASKIRLKQHST